MIFSKEEEESLRRKNFSWRSDCHQTFLDLGPSTHCQPNPRYWPNFCPGVWHECVVCVCVCVCVLVAVISPPPFSLYLPPTPTYLNACATTQLTPPEALSQSAHLTILKLHGGPAACVCIMIFICLPQCISYSDSDTKLQDKRSRQTEMSYWYACTGLCIVKCALKYAPKMLSLTQSSFKSLPPKECEMMPQNEQQGKGKMCLPIWETCGKLIAIVVQAFLRCKHV